MCENCGPMDPEITKAYEEFEAAINKLIETMERVPANSVMVDWVLVTSRSVIHEHGTSTSVGWEAAIDQQHYRTKGLMHEVLDDLTAQDITHRLKHG